MAGIYIHIPFCRQACHYCNFHFATSLHYKKELIESIVKELALQRNYTGDEVIETIYFGGGTPSLCSVEEIKNMTGTIFDSYPVAPGAEVTLEANPDDITVEKLEGWKAAGINRLSIGIQSFFEEDLQWMNRAHNAEQAINNLALAKAHFNNISIDLIYGTPQLTNEKWKQNVDRVIALGIPHISCYALTVEPKTPLDKMIRQRKSEDVDPDKQSEQFLLLMHWLEAAGYEHYEISNFAKPGWQSRHNSSYWQGKKYLGIGPSAHSFDGSSRQWNVANNSQYMQALAKGGLPFEKEVLTPAQQLNEYIMISLRTAKGIDLGRVTAQEGQLLQKRSEKYINSGLMEVIGERLVLTKQGRLLADGIAADLFF